MKDCLVVVANWMPVEWKEFRLAVPFGGAYRLVASSAEPAYGGNGPEVGEMWHATDVPLHGQDHSLEIDLPGLSLLFLEPLERG